MIIGKSLTALGGGGLKPEIIVTAKAGALLNLHYKDSSIILQSYQLGAEETQCTFVVDMSETAYVVEDATNGKSVEVLVDAVAAFDVKIEYVTYLYNEGDECTDITGGFSLQVMQGQTYGYGSSTKEDTYLNIANTGTYDNGGYCSGFTTNKKIDLSQYSTLRVEHTFYESNIDRNNFLAISAAPYQISDSRFGFWVGKYTEANTISTTPYITELDISSVTNSIYINFFLHVNYSSANAKITKAWLE